MTGAFRAAAAVLLLCAIWQAGLSLQQAAAGENAAANRREPYGLREITDDATGVRLSIPFAIVSAGKSASWGGNWSSADGRLKIATLNFRGRKTLRAVYEAIRGKAGRRLIEDASTAKSFRLRGSEANGALFYVLGDEENGEVRGLSITYEKSAEAELAPVVDAVVRSYRGFPSARPAERPPERPASCPDEAQDLARRAAKVKIDLAAPARMRAGETFQFSWRTAEAFSQATPVYAVLAIPGDARFEIPPAPRPAAANNADALAAADAGPALPGFIGLPPSSRAPHELKFGAGATRAIVPLHQPGSRLSGSFAVRMHEAGRTGVQTAIVASTSCGESVIGEAATAQVDVLPGVPEIVVQDPFDIETPKRAVASNSGRYLAQVFDGRYRVFEVATGAKLVDRAGHNPNFSPTSRFVIADVGDADGRDHEVIDLVSREVVAKPAGPFIGWTAGDAFLIDGQGEYGRIGLRSTLIGRSGGGADGWWSATDAWRREGGDDHDDRLTLWYNGGCHACSSWTDTALTLDLDKGLIAFAGDSDIAQAAIFDIASGAKGGAATLPEQKHRVQPRSAKLAWSASEPIRFSQIYDALSEPNASLRDQTWHKAALPMRSALNLHREIAPRAMADEVASLAGPAKSRGDWIEARRSLGAPPGQGGKLVNELSRFGVSAASPAARELAPVFTASVSEAGRARERLDYKKAEAETKAKTAPVRERLLREIPSIAPYLGDGYCTEFPRPDRKTGKIDLAGMLEGLWRWDIAGKALWLMQLASAEGSGAFGCGAILLLDGTAAEPRIVSLSETLDEFWNGQYGVTDHQTRLKPQLYLGRYLAIASVAARNIALYDIKEGKLLTLIKDAPQADLIEDVRLSADAKSILQINSDGQFFIHDAASGRSAVAGRTIDNEVILYTSDGYYWSSYEGAHFVQLRFPGLKTLYSFHQFASVLNRPDIVGKRLANAAEAAPRPQLTPPPALDVALGGEPQAGQIRIQATASSPSGLSRLRIYNDGQLVGETPLSGEAFKGEISVPRLPQARWLSALAIDARGFVSASQGLRLKPEGGSANRLYGVLVGVDAYAEPSVNLTYAKSDANRLAGALEGRDAAYYASQSLNRLLDAAATKQAISAALEKAAASAGPEDTILFFFAGHGVQGGDGRYYLTPSDLNLADIPGTGLPWSEIASKLGSAKARVVVVLDACHSGLSGAEGLATNDDAVKAILSGVRAPMLVLAASKGREFSFEDPKWGGGAFTFALVETLRSKAAKEGGGALNVSDLYRGVREIVIRETEGQQSPWLVRQDLIGDFALF
jgi:hypothetical protein